MRKYFLTLSVILSLLFSACTNSKAENKIFINNKKISEKSKEALRFCRENNMNTDFYILIDLSIHSGLKRFYIWDLKKNKLTHSFPVSHGCCNNTWGYDFSKEKASISNKVDSHCSSTGKFRIGERGYSDWGIHVKYLMHGLEASNSNALKRNIVLHSWEMVDDFEVYPNGSPEGWGCPAISNNNMNILDKKLKKTQKNVLLWIIN
jgi:hypothetical protein